MYFFSINFLFLIFSLINANTDDEHSPSTTESTPPPTNDLGLTFGHKFNKRDNTIIIYFDILNSTLKEYRYYYYDFRPFGTYSSNSEFLPRQRLLDSHNSLRIVGLHEGDYVACLSFVDEYEKILKPRYACYEFTLGEKTVGSHHGSKSGYLAPLLFAVAFILLVFIAIVHHIKAKNYAHKLLHRFIDVTPKSTGKRIRLSISLKELDHPHLSASVQRRLSRVTIDANYEDELNHNEDFINDELPLYTIPVRGRTTSINTMQAIPEYGNPNTMDSIASMRHLMDSVPWIKRSNRSVSSSIGGRNHLRV